MKKQSSRQSDFTFFIDFTVRYLLIVLLGLGNLVLFYRIFRPLTMGAVYVVLQLFAPVIWVGSELFVNGVIFVFVDACVGGSAYYLLFMLVMSTRGVLLEKRLRVLGFSFLLLFTFNVLRILFMIGIVHTLYFDTLHLFIWYVLSTVFVFVAWIYTARKYHITSIPVVSDVLFLFHAISGTSSVKHRKKT